MAGSCWSALDEREADGVACGGNVGRVGAEVDDRRVRDRGDPGAVGEDVGEVHGIGGASGTEIDRTGAALRTPAHVDAHVGGDPVEPRLHTGATLESLGALPRPDHRLLDGVFGLGTRPEHPVAVCGELAPICLEVGDSRSRH